MAVVDVEEPQVINETNCKQKLNKFCRLFAVFLVSHVGLTALVIGYALLGGLIFMKLESPREIKQKEIVSGIRTDYIEKLWLATQRFNILAKPVWIEEAELMFHLFQQDIYTAVKEKGWDGTDSKDDLQWTFAGGLLYSITTITTIGYGHIAPKTAWGRIATMIYAVIGIPLTLLCLSNIGGFLGMCFRFLYGRIICGLCRRRRLQRAAALAAAKVKQGGQDKLGEGEECPVMDESGEPITETETADTDPNDEAAQKENLANEPVRVPVIVVMSVMVAYILLGASVFTVWEKDWNYLEGSYFCFVTLSTIGFGDFVPGTSLKSWSSQEKQILCSLYLLFGLAILAMCFDLIQEQVRHTCRKVGSKLGIIEDKKPETEK